MGKPSTFVSTCTRSSAAAVAKQQFSLSVKILGWAAAAHGKGLTTLKKSRRCNTEEAHNDNATTMDVTDSPLMFPLTFGRQSSTVAHLTVEICSSLPVVKYLYKYIHRTGQSQDRSRKVKSLLFASHWPNLIVLFCIHQHQHQRRHSHHTKI
ncbi:hypothetical protein BKA57DRAFT_243754 [Linnemannia elongata]|nr:hypothetical protein BKA57DRAFT_240713 [Linnemannia elongata]KAH7055065.1 hypothetical protein BKA57DRAFT_243754 [Linnemannia elongata]